MSELFRDFLERKFNEVIDAINQNIDSLINGSITRVNTFVSTLRANGFYGCTQLESIEIPNVTTLPPSIFYNCSSLQKVDFPSVTLLAGSSHFYNCTSLSEVILYGVNQIGNSSFTGCSSLGVVVLKKSTLIPTNSNSFNNTPFYTGGTGGKLYVPQSLISAYQSDSNWATILGYNANNQILAIEGSPYDN